MSDSLIQRLKADRVRPAVLLTQIMKRLSREPSAVFCLVEGYDAPYYDIRVNGHAPKVWKKIPHIFINCSGKQNILDLIKVIKKNDEARRANYLYFVDSDFDDNSKISKDIYVTNGYSVENFYISVTSFSKFLETDIFKNTHLEEINSKILKECQEIFLARMVEFANAALVFNCWYRLQRTKYRNKCDISRVKEIDLVDANLNTIKSKYDLDSLNNEIDEKYRIKNKEIQEEKSWFADKSILLDGRGKQNIRFYRDLIVQFLDLANIGKKPFNRRMRASVQIGYNNAIRQLSIYADTPECLTDYLSRRYRTFTRKMSKRNSVEREEDFYSEASPSG